MTPAEPRVFVSFAGADASQALHLSDRLTDHRIRVFDYHHDMPGGGNIVDSVSRAIDESDYVVLLWSRAAASRDWVQEEWTAAWYRERGLPRVFLFVVRLDDTPLPALLSARRVWDATAGWDAVVDDLLGSWQHDRRARQAGHAVLPSLHDPDPTRTTTFALYVRNADLAVEHVVSVEPTATVAQLLARIRVALALPTRHRELEGRVGLDFSYRLLRHGTALSAEAVLADSGIGDGATLDLHVDVATFIDRVTTTSSYRPDSPDVPPRRVASMRQAAFAHLLPGAARRTAAPCGGAS